MWKRTNDRNIINLDECASISKASDDNGYYIAYHVKGEDIPFEERFDDEFLWELTWNEVYSCLMTRRKK